MRWVHQYSPEIEKKVHRYLRPTNDSWKMDETYIRVKGGWKYLYRAVDSNGNTIDFMLRTYPKSVVIYYNFPLTICKTITDALKL